MVPVSIPQYLFAGQKIFSVSERSDIEPAAFVQTKSVKLIVIYDHSTSELPAGVSSMLERLILACKFKDKEAVVVNSYFNKFSLSQIPSGSAPELILIFGQNTIGRNLAKLILNHPYELGGLKILQTESLLKLHDNKKEKDLLWSALKKMLALS